MEAKGDVEAVWAVQLLSHRPPWMVVKHCSSSLLAGSWLLPFP